MCTGQDTESIMCAATVQQRGGEPAKVTVGSFYDLWSGAMAQIHSDLRVNGLRGLRAAEAA
jgi:hypothetical protein